MAEALTKYQFYRFKDLQAAGIVKSRAELHEKIKKLGFPRPLKDGGCDAGRRLLARIDRPRLAGQALPGGSG